MQSQPELLPNMIKERSLSCFYYNSTMLHVIIFLSVRFATRIYWSVTCYCSWRFTMDLSTLNLAVISINETTVCVMPHCQWKYSPCLTWKACESARSTWKWQFYPHICNTRSNFNDVVTRTWLNSRALRPYHARLQAGHAINTVIGMS